MTDQERLDYSARWLAEHPDAPMAERVAHALVVACDGDPSGRCTFADVALQLGESAEDAIQALYAMRERHEASSQ